MTPVEMKERNLAVSESYMDSSQACESQAVVRVLNRFNWVISSTKNADLHPVGFFDKAQEFAASN